MELQVLLSRIMLTITLIGFLGLFTRLCDNILLKPQRIRSKLRKQGIKGPPPTFLLGNIRDVKKKTKSSIEPKAAQGDEQVIIHNCSSSLFPFFEEWRKEYGQIFMFSLGNTQILHVKHLNVVKEISTCTSLEFGKPCYQVKEWGSLLGHGIVTSNGTAWAHQRKLLAPEFYMEKVKGMINLMVAASVSLVNSWNGRIESEGGVADIRVEEQMRRLSGEVISRACFGSSYSKGEEIFSKLRTLQQLLSKKTLSIGIPGMSYLPIKSNREAWKLEQEIRLLILKVIKERQEAESEKDVLQMILDGTPDGDLGKDVTSSFIVDNCKNLYLAGNETTAVSATWTLMLLASNPEWQDRVRAEIFQVCGGKLPDADMILKMKTLTMVINESLRLYPPATILSREAFQDMKIGHIHVPKGVNVWVPVVTLHYDPEIWGPNADKFDPERFANGVTGACEFPYVYMPFGAGPRICLGQYFSLIELKILLVLVLSNFSLSLSPKYKHSPVLKLVIEPEYGVNILIRKL